VTSPSALPHPVDDPSVVPRLHRIDGAGLRPAVGAHPIAAPELAATGLGGVVHGTDARALAHRSASPHAGHHLRAGLGVAGQAPRWSDSRPMPEVERRGLWSMRA